MISTIDEEAYYSALLSMLYYNIQFDWHDQPCIVLGIQPCIMHYKKSRHR